jgi:hypothetical protein
MKVNMLYVLVILNTLDREHTEQELVLMLEKVYQLLKASCNGNIIVTVEESDLDVFKKASRAETVQEGIEMAAYISTTNSHLAAELEAIDEAVSAVVPSLRHRSLVHDLTHRGLKPNASFSLVNRLPDVDTDQVIEEDLRLQFAVQRLSRRDDSVGKVCAEVHQLIMASRPDEHCWFQ